eukprot:13119628-Alexandrium_andersonii.AAC.1
MSGVEWYSPIAGSSSEQLPEPATTPSPKKPKTSPTTSDPSAKITPGKDIAELLDCDFSPVDGNFGHKISAKGGLAAICDKD